MLNIIDRYIIKRFLASFFGSLIVVASLYVAIDAMTTLLKTAPALPTVIAYYSYSLPQVLVQMLPVACLIATVVTLSSLNRTNELTALFSLGTSLARVSMPILTLVVMFSLLSLAMGDWLLPTLNQKKNYIYYVEIKQQPGMYMTVKTNKIWYRAKDLIFNLKTLNIEEGKAQGLTLYYFNDNWKLVQMVAAKEVKFENNTWHLKDGAITLFAEESSFPLVQKFEAKDIVMESNTFDLKQASDSAEVMSLAQMRAFIKKNKEAGLNTLQYEVDYQSKFSFAFSAFVMSLIGIPFCVRHTRQGGMATSIGIVIGLAFIYWSLYSSGLTLGKHGTLPPVIAAWASNIIMVLASVGLLVHQ